MKTSPFKFLDSYTQADKDIFFGRSQEIEEIYSRLFYSNLLLVYGPSGSGKTSLLQFNSWVLQLLKSYLRKL